MSTFHQTDNHSWSYRTSILEGAIFHKVSYCKFLWGNPCRATETFYHWDFPLNQVLFDDHMHRRSRVHHKFSFLRLRFDAGRHLFSDGEKNVALWCSFTSNTFLASFHAASRALCSCHSVSSCERSSKFGGLGLRSWGSPGEIYPSEGFWSRILVWRAIAFVNFTRWIGLRMSVLFRRIDFGGVMSWNTQPNCRALDDRRWDDFWPNFLSLLLSGFPDRSWHWSVTGPLSCQSPFFNIATALLSSFFLDLLVGCSSTWRCAYEHFLPNLQPLFVL